MERALNSENAIILHFQHLIQYYAKIINAGCCCWKNCWDYWFHRHSSQLSVNSCVQVDTFVKLVWMASWVFVQKPVSDSEGRISYSREQFQPFTLRKTIKTEKSFSPCNQTEKQLKTISQKKEANPNTNQKRLTQRTLSVGFSSPQ